MKEELTRFKTYLQREKKSKATITAYCKDLQDFLEFKKDSENITNELIQRFITRLKEDSLFTNKTINRKLNSISKFCKFLIRINKLDQNPLSDVMYPKFVTKDFKILTKKEIANIFKIAKFESSEYIALHLMLYAGLSIHEVSNLRVDDITLNSNNSFIKVEKDSRKIPITHKLYFVLKDYINTQKPTIHLFSTKNNKKIHVRNLRSIIEKISEKSKIDFKPTDLKNTFIVNQLNLGCDIDYLASIVGYKSAQSKAKFLKHLNSEKSFTTKEIFDF